jgi:hypothetical protein
MYLVCPQSIEYLSTYSRYLDTTVRQAPPPHRIWAALSFSPLHLVGIEITD